MILWVNWDLPLWFYVILALILSCSCSQMGAGLDIPDGFTHSLLLPFALHTNFLHTFQVLKEVSLPSRYSFLTPGMGPFPDTLNFSFIILVILAVFGLLSVSPIHHALHEGRTMDILFITVSSVSYTASHL